RQRRSTEPCAWRAEAASGDGLPLSPRWLGRSGPRASGVDQLVLDVVPRQDAGLRVEGALHHAGVDFAVRAGVAAALADVGVHPGEGRARRVEGHRPAAKDDALGRQAALELVERLEAAASQRLAGGIERVGDAQALLGHACAAADLVGGSAWAWVDLHGL